MPENIKLISRYTLSVIGLYNEKSHYPTTYITCYGKNSHMK